METTASGTRDTKAILRNKIVTFFSKPQNIILLVFGIVLTFSTVAPIVAIVRDTFQIHPGTIDAHLTGKASGYSVVNYVDLFTSRLAMTNLWKPLINTVILSVMTCVISILYGGFFAFLVTRTNMRFKKYLSSIFRTSCHSGLSPSYGSICLIPMLSAVRPMASSHHCSASVCRSGSVWALSRVPWYSVFTMHRSPTS